MIFLRLVQKKRIKLSRRELGKWLIVMKGCTIAPATSQLNTKGGQLQESKDPIRSHAPCSNILQEEEVQ